MPPTPLADELRPDAQGFLKMTRKGYFESFGQDLQEVEKAVLFATHAPTNGASLGGAITDASSGRSIRFDRCHSAVLRGEDGREVAGVRANLEDARSRRHAATPSAFPP